MSRSECRERVYQVLFSEDFKKDEIKWNDTLENFRKEDWKVSEDDLNYINAVCNGVVSHYDEIAELINKHLKGYTLNKLYKTDRTALLIAVFELKWTDTPQKVVVNEAVELSKKYGTDKSPAFVNGVLSGVLREMNE